MLDNNCTLWENTNYLSPIMYLNSSSIVEYDIKQANITMLYGYNMISKEQYEYLSGLPKQDRERYVGIMIGEDKEVYKSIKNGIKNARKFFMEENNIKDSEIIRIANDAIYVNCNYHSSEFELGFTLPNKNIVGRFAIKNVFDTYIKLDKLSIFFKYNRTTGDCNFNVIGMTDEALALHEGYMLNFLIEYLTTLKISSPEQCVSFFNDFFQKYINRQLPIGYYREFNSRSKFNIGGGNSIWNMDYLEERDKGIIDIECNGKLLRELFAKTLTLYMQNLNI